MTVRSYQQTCAECDGPPFTAAATFCPFCGTEQPEAETDD